MDDKDFESILSGGDAQRLGTTKSEYKVNRSTFDGTLSQNANSESRGGTETNFAPGVS